MGSRNDKKKCGKNSYFNIERPLLSVIAAILLFVGTGPAAYAGIGDSKQKMEAQYGAAWLIQNERNEIWTQQEWQTGTHGKAVAYGYWHHNDNWRGIRWVEYDKRGKVAKETVLLDTEIRIKDFSQYFKTMHEAVTQKNSKVFTTSLFEGENLGVVVQASDNKLNYIQFFIIPDGTEINMHSKISGFAITEITAQTVKRHFADKTWRKTDNYFTAELFFSEALVPRKHTDMIVVHHTAIDNMSVADIHALHLTKGWAGIGYHKVILPDGTVQDGRPEEMIGAHALGVNPDSIGIVVDGNFENKLPTTAQMDSLVNLIYALMKKYQVPLDRVVPHRNVTEGTSCPGARFN